MSNAEGAPPDERRAGGGRLVERDAGEVLGGELHERAVQGDRRGGAGHRHGHQVRRHAGARGVDQRRGGQVAPGERRRRTAVEERQRALAQCRLPAADGGEQGEHGREPVLGEGAGDDRFATVLERQQQAPAIGDLVRDVARDEGGRLRGEMRQGVDPTHELDHVGGGRGAPVAGSAQRAIDPIDGGRPRVEGRPSDAELDRRGAGAIVEREARRRGREGRTDEALRNVDAFLALGGAGREQQLGRLSVLDPHPDALEGEQRLLDQPSHRVGRQELEAHGHDEVSTTRGARR